MYKNLLYYIIFNLLVLLGILLNLNSSSVLKNLNVIVGLCYFIISGLFLAYLAIGYIFKRPQILKLIKSLNTEFKEGQVYSFKGNNDKEFKFTVLGVNELPNLKAVSIRLETQADVLIHNHLAFTEGNLIMDNLKLVTKVQIQSEWLEEYNLWRSKFLKGEVYLNTKKLNL